MCNVMVVHKRFTARSKFYTSHKIWPQWLVDGPPLFSWLSSCLFLLLHLKYTEAPSSCSPPQPQSPTNTIIRTSLPSHCGTYPVARQRQRGAQFFSSAVQGSSDRLLRGFLLHFHGQTRRCSRRRRNRYKVAVAVDGGYHWWL